MANAISSALHAQQVAQATPAEQNSQPKATSKQNATPGAVPQDTVTISSAAQKASQATQNQPSGGDGNSDYDGK